MRETQSHEVVVVGGGTAGLAVSAQLLRQRKGTDVAIIEPQTKHYYQPGWTMVGGGIFQKQETERYPQVYMGVGECESDPRPRRGEKEQ